MRFGVDSKAKAKARARAKDRKEEKDRKERKVQKEVNQKGIKEDQRVAKESRKDTLRGPQVGRGAHRKALAKGRKERVREGPATSAVAIILLESVGINKVKVFEDKLPRSMSSSTVGIKMNGTKTPRVGTIPTGIKNGVKMVAGTSRGGIVNLIKQTRLERKHPRHHPLKQPVNLKQVNESVPPEFKKFTKKKIDGSTQKKVKMNRTPSASEQFKW